MHRFCWCIRTWTWHITCLKSSGKGHSKLTWGGGRKMLLRLARARPIGSSSNSSLNRNPAMPVSDPITLCLALSHHLRSAMLKQNTPNGESENAKPSSIIKKQRWCVILFHAKSATVFCIFCATSAAFEFYKTGCRVFRVSVVFFLS